MRRYSAAEAIGPAWENTTALMWQRGRWLTGLKIALVAFLAEMGGAGFNYSIPGRHSSHVPAEMQAAMMGLAVVFGFIIFVVGIILFYVGSRMQFVHFACIAYKQTTVGPLWTRYGRLTWRWIGFKILLMLAFLVPLLPIMLVMTKRVSHVTPGGTSPALGSLFALMGVIFVLLIPFIMLYTAARDFVLPSVALEGTTVRFALKRFGLWLQAEPGGVIGFLFLRLILGFVFAICAEFALLFAAIISAIPFVLIGLAVWMPLRHASAGAHVLVAALIGFLALVFFAWMIALTLAIFGTLLTFYISWGTYYLGGRYPMLGDLLEPPYTHAAFTPPPSMPSGDDSSGPDLPLNPQPAG